MSACGKCHQCEEPLFTVLDGEEWCERCQTYRRYHAHGWALGASDRDEYGCVEAQP